MTTNTVKNVRSVRSTTNAVKRQLMQWKKIKIVRTVGQSLQGRNSHTVQYSLTVQQGRNSTNGQDEDNRNRRTDDEDGPGDRKQEQQRRRHQLARPAPTPGIWRCVKCDMYVCFLIVLFFYVVAPWMWILRGDNNKEMVASEKKRNFMYR